MPFQKILHRAQGLLRLALQNQIRRHAQNQPFVGRVPFGCPAIGLVGQVVFVLQLVVDAECIPGVRFGRLFLVRCKDRR